MEVNDECPNEFRMSIEFIDEEGLLGGENNHGIEI